MTITERVITNGHVVEFHYEDILCQEYNVHDQLTGNTLELLSPIVQIDTIRKTLYLTNNYHPHCSLDNKKLCLGAQQHIYDILYNKQYEHLYWPIYDYLSVCNDWSGHWAIAKMLKHYPTIYSVQTTHLKQENLCYSEFTHFIYHKYNTLPLKNDNYFPIIDDQYLLFYNNLTENERDAEYITRCYHCGNLKIINRPCNRCCRHEH